MEEPVHALGIPGMELEPLEPFLEDVFVGMDDHPPGLWPPTLLEAQAMQLQNTPADNLPLDSTGSQHVLQIAREASLLHEAHSGHFRAAHISEQFRDSMPRLQQEGHSDLSHHQHHHNTGSGSEVFAHASVPPHTLPRKFLHLSDEQHPRPATNGTHEALTDMHNSSSSSTLSPVAPADELAASSSSAQLQYESSLAAAADSDAGRISSSILLSRSGVLDSSISADKAAVVHVLGADPSSVVAAAAAAHSCADNAATHCGSSSSSASKEQLLGEWVPDIDEVALESLRTGAASLAPAGAEPGVAADDSAPGQQQNSDDGSRHSWLGDQQLLLQDPLQISQSGRSASMHSAALGSTEDTNHHSPHGITRCTGQQQQSHTFEQQRRPEHTPQELQQQEPTVILRSASLGVVTAAEVTAAAGHDLAAGSDDSGEFVSPSVSWHSCMTAASHTAAANSHMTAHSIVSAASFSTPKCLATLSVTTPARLGLSAAHSHDCSSQGLTKGDNAATAAAADGDDDDDDDPAATSDEFACFLDPLGALEHGEQYHQQQQQHQQQQAEAASQMHDQLHGAHPSASLHQQHMDSAGLCESTCETSDEQRQRWQQELWQDVSPPSLGSSPPTPGGYTTVHDMHLEEVPATETQSRQETGAAARETSGSTAAAAASSGVRREAHSASLRPGQCPFQGHIANSSYLLRQSELVDLSLSTSLHPGHQQHIRPGWLTAHQRLPPAAAQAVERAVSALNDSYFFHERLGVESNGPVPHVHQQQQQPGPPVTHGPRGTVQAGSAGAATGVQHQPSSGTTPAAGLASSGLLGPALIRRSGSGHPWSHASTQPQQDQAARHRLPSNVSHHTGWAGAGVLGQWFSSTVQQPLTAVANRAAAGVGKRLAGVAGGVEGDSAAATGSAPVAAGPGHNSTDSSDIAMQDAVIVEHTPDLPQSLQEQEDTAFQGLLFLGGRDSHGRPVVIVNTDAIPAGHNSAPRDAALAYLLKKLSPVVSKGPYVLIMVAFQHGPQFRLLPGVWCVRAYHALPRAFRKNVKHVVLLQPSLLVRAGLALLHPFVSSKAHAKIKQVHRLLDIEAATSGEVQVPHLGEAFLTTVQQFSKTQQQAARTHEAEGTSRTVPVPGARGH